MKRGWMWGAAMGLVLLLNACTKQNQTVETLRRQVAQYEQDLSAETSAQVSATFDKLDAELGARLRRRLRRLPHR